ncbi:MAG: sugar-binding domain-containing protein, partial [Bacteroidota bacterium]
MSRFSLAFLFLLLFQLNHLPAQPVWRPAPSPLTTPWTDKVSPQSPLPEYPRPQMVRHNWVNLNGLWDFLVMDKNTDKIVRQGKILVPYPIESALSGVGMKLEPHHILIYKMRFGVPQDWAGERILLHFGAVDWSAEISVNKQKVGSHKGGYDPFSLDITDFLTGKFGQELTVQVTDPGSSGGQPVGK